jgi:hypothetical protein
MVRKDTLVEDLRRALLKYDYSPLVVERILRWYS